MSLIDRANRIAAKRETPVGREYELRIILVDCVVLSAGCFGLALSFPPLIYLAALGHLAAGFLLSIAKWFWFVSSALIIAIAAGVLMAGVYVVQRFYVGIADASVVADLGSNWPLFVAVAIVVSGIVGNLISYVGNLGELVDFKNRAQ